MNDGEGHGMHEHKWNYNNNGNDWKVMYPECRTKYQSPIDLSTTKVPTFDWKDDKFNFIYTNQLGDINVDFNGHTS